MTRKQAFARIRQTLTPERVSSVAKHGLHCRSVQNIDGRLVTLEWIGCDCIPQGLKYHVILDSAK